jgi:tetratricopeptide (TPR) repeat protein
MKSQYDSAIAEYTNAFSVDSTYVEALTNRGVIRDLHNDRDAAIRDYSLAIKINPSYAEAYAKRASTYQLSGKYGKALADYDAAIKLGTGGSYEFDSTLHFANAYYGRGIVYYKMGEFKKAIADYDSVLALSPRHSLAMLNRGVALFGAKQYDSAIAGLTRAIDELAPSEYGDARGQAFMHRGNAFKMLSKFDKAIDDYRNALEYSGLAAKACWRIAECYSLKQDRENAIDWLKKAISHGYIKFNVWKNDPDLSYVRGDKEFRDLQNKIPPTRPAGRKE